MTEVRGAAGAGTALEVLHHGSLDLTGRLVDASNATFLGRVTLGEQVLDCVYKPVRGERPLWDFPTGTRAGREVAAYLVSERAGWHVVPPTLLRDGPFGPGMVQAWVDVTAEPAVDLVAEGDVPDGWRRVLDAYDVADNPVSLVHADTPELRRIAVFDVVINNADRKAGHLLPERSGRVLGCDHGVSFHAEDKLRTILWGWAGEPLTAAERDQIDVAGAAVGDAETARLLGELISAEEYDALVARLAGLRSAGVLPEPGGRWPSIPWPPL